jgi:glycosyltransferase involved in cell wall biosynthesis
VLRIYPTANDTRHRRRDHELARLGVEVGLVAPVSYGPDWAPTPIEPELRHWRSRLVNRNSIPLHLWDPRVLRRAVREFAPDVVDVHEECYFPAAAEAVHAARGRPVTMFAAQNIAKRYPLPIRLTRDWVLRRVAAMYACSTDAATVLRQWGYRGRVATIPFGVEDELFDVRASGGRVGFVGRLSPQKGVRELLPFGSRLLCVGSGELDGEVRASGAEVVVARTVGDLAAQLARMAVVVMPSRTIPNQKEQFGRTAAEAMAAGVPVVAYDCGSLPEVVGDAGVIVREGDTASLHGAVESLLAGANGLGERGRERANRLYRWTSVARQMANLYEEALAR